MTAIVGFMNKHGVAVAADSAVTLGNTHKVVNSGNKIFTLSKYAPVGIATYGNASFMETYYREGSITRSFGSKHVADYLLLGVRMLRFCESIIESQESTLTLDESKELGKFAEGILEGACYNVAISCKRLIKLLGIEDVKAFYNRVDERVSREELCNNKSLHAYYWNGWTPISLKI